MYLHLTIAFFSLARNSMGRRRRRRTPHETRDGREEGGRKAPARRREGEVARRDSTGIVERGVRHEVIHSANTLTAFSAKICIRNICWLEIDMCLHIQPRSSSPQHIFLSSPWTWIIYLKTSVLLFVFTSFSIRVLFFPFFFFLLVYIEHASRKSGVAITCVDLQISEALRRRMLQAHGWAPFERVGD